MAGPADAGAVVSPDAVEAVGKHGAGERKTGKRSGGERGKISARILLEAFVSQQRITRVQCL